MKKVLTVAGSDSGGGAGIQADLKTFAALQVYGTSAITAVTAQNTCSVAAVHTLPADFVVKQIEAVVEDIGVDGMKTGMLANSAIIEAVADTVKLYRLAPLIVDPVMVAQSGDFLLEKEAVRVLKEKLLPLATVVTPNLDEATILSGQSISSLEDMKEAARAIYFLGTPWVLVKGGHLEGLTVTDLLYDGKEFSLLSSPRLEVRNTHGTGCTYAAATAAFLACGLPVPAAVEQARSYLLEALQHGLSIGRGSGPVHHFIRFYRE